MKRYYFILSIVSILCLKIHAYNSTDCTTFLYRGKPFAPLFIPSENDSILNVRINLIFIQKDDGTGNFQENDNEQQRLLDDAITILNDKMAGLKMPGADCYAGTEAEFVHNSRIRFIDHRYYIRKSSVWNNNISISEYNLCPGNSNWYLSGVDDSITNSLPDTLKGINIYFTEDASIYHNFWEIHDATDTSYVWPLRAVKGCSHGTNADNLHASSRIHIPCRYSRYWWFKNIVPQLVSEGMPQWYNEGWLLYAGTLAGDLAHEIGHSFNLRHPNDIAEWGNEYFSYPDSGCVATIMQPHASISTRDFLPPQEIGLMYFSSMTTNLQQYIPFNTYLGAKILNTTVSLPRMRMYYSLIIGSSGNVTMPCDMIFSPQSYIEVQSGGVLTVDNASLQSIQGSWGGIIVKSGGKLILSDVAINDYNIVIESGGSLIITNDLTVSGDHSITIEDGGYLCIDEDASMDLEDSFSVIIISPNAILGCPVCNNCILTCSDLTNSGNGHFITYEGTSYLQNITISSDYLATGNMVNAGYDVTSTQSYGNVVVENGGELRIKANETTLTKGVEVRLGGTLTIDK